MKTCTKCGETKPLDEFYGTGRGGREGMCKVCKRAKQRAYREANLERDRERKRSYREANLELIAEKARAWREANSELDRERKRVWREANRDRINREGRAYYLNRRDEISARRRANPHLDWRYSYQSRCRAFGLTPTVERFTRADVVDRYGDSCAYCKAGPFEHLDHYEPISAGGPHTLENVRPSCAACNVSKSDLSPDEWMAEQAALDDLTEEELESAVHAEVDRWTA